MNIGFAALLAYLLGSVPTGVLLARKRGIDLKKVGSGNIGATNVLRAAGKGAAIATLTGDILKGVLAVMIGQYFFPGRLSAQGIIGFFAVLGHDFSLFTRFRGGKGVATSIGVLVVYAPIAAAATIIIWVVMAVTTRYSSIGALVSFGLMPGIVYVSDQGEKVPVALLLSVLLFIRHRENIGRLAAGTENRIGGR